MLEASIRDVKTGGAAWDDRPVVVRGYYFSSPVPMLVDDPRRPFWNMPIPEPSYLLLVPHEELDWNTGEGDLIEIRGRIRVTSQGSPQDSLQRPPRPLRVELLVRELPQVIRALGSIDRFEFLKPLPFAQLLAKLPDLTGLQLTGTRRRLVLLMSGGVEPQFAHERYWNDIAFLYETLTKVCGVPPADVRVIYKDGNSEDGAIPVDGAATKPIVKQALGDIAAESTANTDVFLFFGNHGAGVLLDSPNLAGNNNGRLDLDGDETDEGIFEYALGSDLTMNGSEDDQLAYDEAIYLYDTTERLWDDDLRAWIAPIQGNVVVVIEPCFAGGFVGDLAGPNRVIIGACSEWELSHATATLQYDEFIYWFTVALAGSEPSGTSHDADANGNGRVSVAEAFEFAAGKDSMPETPWYEDDGDGRGRRTAFGTHDGAVGQKLYLDGKP